MAGYVKIYQSILDSSIWQEDAATRLVWITMLAMADRNGCLECSTGGLARRANVSRPACETALLKLSSPDPDDKSRVLDGVRIQKIDRGWLIVNHSHYRDIRTPEQFTNAARQKRFYEKHKNVSPNDLTTPNGSSGNGYVAGNGSDAGSVLPEGESGGKPKRKKAITTSPKTWRVMPVGWNPTPTSLEEATALGVDVELELRRIRSHRFKKAHTDPDFTWETWYKSEYATKKPGHRNGSLFNRQQQPKQPNSGYKVPVETE